MVDGGRWGEGLFVLMNDDRAANILLSARSSARASMLMASCARRIVVGASRWVDGWMGRRLGEVRWMLVQCFRGVDLWVYRHGD